MFYRGCDLRLSHAQKEKAELAELVIQQSAAIDVLKEEATALRRDLAFVGNHVNITVAPSNPYLDELPPLPLLSQQQQQQQSANQELPAHMLGVSPSSDVRPFSLNKSGQHTSSGCGHKHWLWPSAWAAALGRLHFAQGDWSLEETPFGRDHDDIEGQQQQDLRAAAFLLRVA